MTAEGEEVSSTASRSTCGPLLGTGVILRPPFVVRLLLFTLCLISLTASASISDSTSAVYVSFLYSHDVQVRVLARLDQPLVRVVYEVDPAVIGKRVGSCGRKVAFDLTRADSDELRKITKRLFESGTRKSATYTISPDEVLTLVRGQHSQSVIIPIGDRDLVRFSQLLVRDALLDSVVPK